MSELCLIEMDRLYPSENMASISQTLDSSPVYFFHCVAWRLGVRSECAALVPGTVRVRWWDPRILPWLIVRTRDWIGDPQRWISRQTQKSCKLQLCIWFRSGNINVVGLCMFGLVPCCV